MKVIVTSTYENVDQEWLDWWLERLSVHSPLPGGREAASTLQSETFSSFSSKDPTSDVIATTTYEIKK